MAKSEETLRLEESIYAATNKQGVFGCFEVTIGWWGKERVDYLTYETKGIWRCYEVKATVSDFHSPAAKTFIGHYNYFVMTKDLYDKVSTEIPPGIGVYVGGECVRKAKRQPLGAEEKVLYESMVRSLSREYQLTRRSQNRDYIQRLRKAAERAQEESRNLSRQRAELSVAVMEVFGPEGWRKIRDYLHNDSPREAEKGDGNEI